MTTKTMTPSSAMHARIEHHAWRHGLSKEVKGQIARLSVIDDRKNLRVLSFFGIWAAAGFAAVNIDLIVVRLACYVLMGASIHGLGILMHEGVHRTMFRNPSLNHWVAFLCGVPALLSVSSYRVGHLPHHRHERNAGDPDELENVSTNPRILSLLFMLTLLAGEIFGVYRVGPLNVFKCKPAERRAIVLEYSIIVFIATIVVVFVPGWILLHAWLFPVLVGRQLTNVRTLSEHVLTDRDNPVSPTRTVVSNKFVSYFMCNLNYHTEHHLFPSVPYYNLRSVHTLLKEEFLAHGVQVYRSYTEFLTDLAAFMVHAWLPWGNEERLVLLQRRERGMEVLLEGQNQ